MTYEKFSGASHKEMSVRRKIENSSLLIVRHA